MEEEGAVAVGPGAGACAEPAFLLEKVEEDEAAEELLDIVADALVVAAEGGVKGTVRAADDGLDPFAGLTDKALAGDTIEGWGDASRPKDMVYVKDFCQMLFKACFVERETGYYNVGTGVGTTLLEQIQGMIDVFGKEGHKSKIIMRPDMPNAPQYIMDITSAREELGYEPKYDYISMLEDFKIEMEKDKKNQEAIE